MKYLIVFSLMVCLAQTQAQKKVCEALVDGPYLGTQPVLDFMFDEATQDDLAAGDCTTSSRFRSEIKVQGEVGEYTLEFKDGPGPNPLSLTKLIKCDNKIYLQLSQPVDRDGFTTALEDDVSFITTVVECKPNNGDVSQTYNTRFFIMDVNDNSPKFPDDVQTASISEAAEVGSLVMTVTAEDKDQNLDQGLSYSLESQDPVPFTIGNKTGEIFLKAPLDFEAMGDQKYYMFTVRAEDAGPGDTKSNTTEVQINILDSDDLPPAFIFQGCLQHEGVCAWPKYTAGLSVKKDKVIEVYPVPNKVKSTVQIEAYDRDMTIANEIVFKISSTVPPGHENKFRVETMKTDGNRYTAKVFPNEDLQLKEGFEIFLAAEEQSIDRKSELSMIFFTGEAGSSSSSGQAGSDSNDNDDSGYSDREVALIVVTAILATLVLCLLIGLFCVIRRKQSSKQDEDVAMGQTNGSYRL